MSVREPDRPSHCPTPTGHRRLDEVHRFWHECLAGYQDPEEFRVKLNACIQALRNTTFAMQKEKDRIADFDDWYGPWQDRMKTDRIMTWLNQARVTIVHAGDLETYSVARVRLVGGYEDATAAVVAGLPLNEGEGLDEPEFEASSPGLPLGDIVEEIRASALPRRHIEQATLSVERRWVDSELPSVELLEALAYAYGFLGRMVEEVHSRAGLDHGVAVEHDGQTVRLQNVAGHAGRLPCMVTTRTERTLNLSMKDGQVATGGKSWFMTPQCSEASLVAAQERYKLRRRPRQSFVMDAVDWLPDYVDSARSIIRAGEEHGWFVFFFKGRHLQGSKVLMARDGADKRALAQEIAEMVALNGYDGVIDVGEVWQAPVRLDAEGFALPAAEHPDKLEAVALHAETADGRQDAALVPFRRRRIGRPVVQETVEVDAQNLFLAHVRAVWKSWGRTPYEGGPVLDPPER